jgi:hypothetical protein
MEISLLKKAKTLDLVWQFSSYHILAKLLQKSIHDYKTRLTCAADRSVHAETATPPTK